MESDTNTEVIVIQDTTLKIPKPKLFMNRLKAKEFFKTFPVEKIQEYKDYWEKVSPKTNEDIFRRYLFAFCSVHTTWEGNIRGYNAIKDFNQWIDNKELLLEKLKNSGVGLHNNRTKYIWAFKDQFWKNPKEFYFTSKKGHVKKRDEIASKIKGLGLAKVSFALEMIHPNKARILCGDIHHLRLYGMDSLIYNKSSYGMMQYKNMERDWIRHCGKLNVSSYIARVIFWDKLQAKDDSRYWSYVLE